MEKAWRTVKVFISSTFRDMQAERDWLVRIVFPELKERCTARHLHLVDVDLRWGVTEEEAEQGNVLDIILSEIDRSRPFFIAILGERYGSVSEKVPKDTEFTHSWLRDYPGHSYTALEIVHGVLHRPNIAQRAFFYFRDPHFISQIPEGKRSNFTAESPESALKLTALKDKIRASGRPVMENYPARWDDAQGRVVCLDIFGQRVLEDLWTAICAEYPAEAPEIDPLTIERQAHDSFAEERSRLHVGRTSEGSQLTQYVMGTDRRPVVITGESGCGKSAFLASWSHKYTAEHPDDFVLTYFIGASPDSTQYLRLLRNICEVLKRHFNLKEEIPKEDQQLSETLAVLLSEAVRDKARIVFVLDALDQLSAKETAHGLRWLVDYIPEKVRLVVSSLEGDCLDVLRRRGVEEIPLPPLVEKEQRQIVQNMLDEWRRKLDERQMATLLAHPCVKSPLYLRVALEELKLFGKYEELTTRIKTLADSIPGLFDQVLARLEEDHGRWLVSETFGLLQCSRYGLSELEMLELLRREGEEQFPRVLWARLFRSAEAYLVQRGPLLNFFHRQLADAVTARYLSQETKHDKLAIYFQSAPIERKVDEYPFQLEQSQQWEALSATLVDLHFFGYALMHDREYEWMGYWRALEGRFEPGKCYLDSIEARIKQEGENLEVASLLDLITDLLQQMALYGSALPFAQRALAIREKILGPNDPDVASTINNIAAIYRDQGEYEKALPLLQRALSIQQQATVPNYREIATNLNNLATLYIDKGKYIEASLLYKQALSILEQTLHPDHPAVGTNLSNLAVLYLHQGKYEEALPILQRALAIKEKALGPAHPSVARSLSNIAELYTEQGKYEEALPLLKRALAIREKVLGPDHPNVAVSLSNIAGLYVRQGKYEEALPIFRRALTIQEKALEPNHPDIALILANIADLFEKQGKYEEALQLCQRAMEMKVKTLGQDHPDVAKSLDNMALLLYKQINEQGQYEELLSMFYRALEIRLKTLGQDHPDVASSFTHIALIYREQGKFDEAIPLCQKALVILETTFGPDHPRVATALTNLAELYRNQGKYTEALPLYQKALAITEKALGPDHLLVATSLNNLAELYIDQKKYAAALPLHQRALSIREKALGPDHPDVATSLDNVAGLFHILGMNEDALPLYQRALTVTETALGFDHPEVATRLNNLAVFYHDQGEDSEALCLYQRALYIKERTRGSNHREVAPILNNLADLYIEHQKFDEAIPLIQRVLSIREITSGPDSFDISKIVDELAQIYVTLGKYDEALPLSNDHYLYEKKYWVQITHIWLLASITWRWYISI